MPTIIVVEDDPSVAVLIGELLTLRGFEVISSATGDSCLATLPQAVPKLVIADLFLPDITASVLFERITEFYLPNSVLFLLMSAHSENDFDFSQYQSFGAVFIRKPFEIASFLRKIDYLCTK
jgi:DNA-binding response OmpR family regulator